jgi:hypothetical protein
MTPTIVSAADARYGKWLINLVGSVQRKSGLSPKIAVYDLGLTPFQRRLLDGAEGVDVLEVPPFVPHWRQGRTWKTWIWKHAEADTVIWLDAGVTILRPLTDFLDQTAERGYFVVSTGVSADKSTPSDYYDLYQLPPAFGRCESITAGILAFERSSPFYENVIEPTFEDAIAGRNLGFSEAEVSKLNWGLDELDRVIVRDCPLFRHEQTVLNIHFYSSLPEPFVNDLYKYGGWLSPHDHPAQVIWNHRRRGDYRFLPRVRYRPSVGVVGLPWGAGVYLLGRWRHYRWLLRPSIHARVARRFLTTRRLRSQR